MSREGKPTSPSGRPPREPGSPVMDIHAKLNQAIQYQQAGRLDSARRVYRQILSADPCQPDSLHLLGLIDLQNADIPKAISRIQGAISNDPRQAIFFNSLGNAHRENSQLKKALVCYRKALALKPEYALAHFNMGTAYQELTKWVQAVNHYRAAVQLDPSLYQAHNNLGLSLKAVGQDEKAIDHFQIALRIRPDHTDAYDNLASTLEGLNRLDESKKYVRRSLTLDPDSFFANLNLAKINYRTGNLDRAKAILDTILDRCVPEYLAAHAYTIKGFVDDKLGRYDDAFAAFEAGNRHELNSAPGRRLKEKHREDLILVDRIIDGFRDRRFTARPGAPPSDHPVLIAFLVGFPRSGTTLIEQILNSHSKIATIDEKPVLDALVRSAIDGTDLRRWLSETDTAFIRRFRARYFNMVDYQTIGCHGRKLVVDKLPLNVLNIGFIQHFFPEAKIIVALRHPLDSILSNYMQRFRLNARMYNFLQLDTAARFYAKIMGFYLNLRYSLALGIHEVRYENIVDDIAGESRKMMRFLNLPWEAGMLNYHKKAKKRNINTPSYAQVVQPIYTSSVLRWRHYAKPLSPIFPVVQPVIEAFAYERITPWRAGADRQG